LGHDVLGSSGPADEIEAPPAPAAVPAGPGIGIAEAAGRLLWADDAFCVLVGRSRDDILGAAIADVLALAPEDAADAASAGGLLRIAGEDSALALRVVPLGAKNRPTAFMLDVGGSTSPQPDAGRPGSIVAAFVLDGDGNVCGLWGAPREITLFGTGSRFRPGTEPGGKSAVAQLVDRAVRGMAAIGFLLVDGIPRVVRAFPVDLPGRDRPGLVVAVTTPGTRRFRPAAGPVEPQVGMGRLARYALAGEGRSLLIEEAVRLAQTTLDADVCAAFEFLPDRRGRPATTAPVPVVGDVAEGLLIAPIDGPSPFGVLAVQRRAGARFDPEETVFVAGVADILAVAVRRLAGEERQREASLHDPLTGLPNRALILDHLALALARAPRQPSPVGVLFVDLERFKLVNDTLGHGVGDELLVAVAERLAGGLRPSDTLGRLGGDEFLVVCEEVGSETDALALAGRLAGAFRAPFRVGGHDLSLTASIGVAISRPDSDPAALLGEADAAMYASKEARRQIPVVFQERMRPSRVAIPRATFSQASGGPQPGDGLAGRRLSDLVARLVGMLNDLDDVDGFDGDLG
jgi:diguanylate cyclase (GGDEF)-like protein